MEIKDWVKSARQLKDWTQRDLGERLSVTKQNVSAWEKGRHEPSFQQLRNIASITGFPLMEHDIAKLSATRAVDVELPDALKRIATAIDSVPADRIPALAENMAGWVRSGAVEPWTGIVLQLLKPSDQSPVEPVSMDPADAPLVLHRSPSQSPPPDRPTPPASPLLKSGAKRKP